jgi:hypothetical protein
LERFDNDIRIDVENPQTRKGQIQIQRGTGKRKDTRIVDPKTGEIREANRNNSSNRNRISNKELKNIKKDPRYERAIEKAKRILGEEEQP